MLLIGHVLDKLAELPAESVQCMVTSGPYWGLRDYSLPPVVWDDPGGCEHEWGDERLRSVQPISDKTGLHKDGRLTPITDKYRETLDSMTPPASQGQFCQLCGAWRGCLGLEPTPELYIQHMVEVFREARRVLRKDGTLWLNMGDSYARSGGTQGGSKRDLMHLEGKQKRMTKIPKGSGLKPKDLVGMPWRVALALQADGWWLRSDIIWSKPNPMPESVTDRPTSAHEHIFLLTKADRYFYDAEAAKQQLSSASIQRLQQDNFDNQKGGPKDYARTGQNKSRSPRRALVNLKGRMMPPQVGDDPAAYAALTGRNQRDVWTIATQPYPKAHFSTFPEEIPKRAILAGTSAKGCCPECGAAWERVVEKEFILQPDVSGDRGRRDAVGNKSMNHRKDGDTPRGSNKVSTIDWRSTCEHAGAPIPCTVLDPFAGSGTVGKVATELGREYILIEQSEEYVPMIKERTATTIGLGL